MNKGKTDEKKIREKKPRDLHSRAFRRYFLGYEEIGRLDEKGNTRIERVYNGDWYVRALDARALGREKLLLAVLCVLSAATFIFAALRDLAGNRSWYLSVAHVAAFAMLLWTASGLFNYLGDGAKMTVGEARSGFLRLCRASLFASAALGLCTLLYLICAAFDRAAVGGHLLCAAACLIGALMLFFVSRTGKRAPYEIVKRTELQ